MKKTISYILLFLILAAGVVFGLVPSFSADAAGETAPANLRWDPAEFGMARWDAVDGATKYKVKLYKQISSGWEQVENEIDCGNNRTYNFLSVMRNKGVGTYTFTVGATIAGADSAHTSIDSNNLSFYYSKLNKPINLSWDWNTSDIVRATWSGVSGAENYNIEIYKKESLDAGYVSMGIKSYGSNTSAAIFEDIKIHGSGHYSFKVSATSSKMDTSDWSDFSSDFKYPIDLETPKNVRWGHANGGDDYGVAKWAKVSNAARYEVQFYKVHSYVEKDDEGNDKIVKVLKELSTPMVVRMENSNVDIYANAAQYIGGNTGEYTFTVKAVGADESFKNSEPTKMFKDEYVPVKNSDGYYIIDPEKDIIGDIYFNYVAPTAIHIYVDGVKVDLSKKPAFYLAVGQEKIVNVAVEPSDATPTKFIWSNSKNSSVFGLFDTQGDRLQTLKMSALVSRGGLEISVSPHLSDKIQTINITSSEPPVKIEISGKNSYTTNDTGELYLKVSPSTADGSMVDWISENPNVATVNQSGKVTTTNTLLSGKGTEYTKIIVRSKLNTNVTGEYKIAVSNIQISPERISIESDVGNYTVALKGKLQLTAKVYSGGIGDEINYAYNKEVSWYSSDDKIATVDQNGLVIPKAQGKVIITAVSKADGSSHVTGEKEITVEEEKIHITKVTLSGGSTVKVGEKLNLKAAITPNNATERDLVWEFTSANYYSYGELNSVDNLNYTLTGLREGDCEVSVYSKNAPGIKVTLKVKVTSASDKPSTEDGETQVITDAKPVAGTGDKKNEYTAVIKPETINEAIEKVLEEAAILKTTPVVRIRVDTPTAAVDLITSIPYSSVGRLVSYYSYNSNKAVLEIETGIATMRLNAEALRRIYNKAYSNADIEIKMSRTVKSELNEEQQRAVGTRSVAELTIRSAGKEISEFDGYPITISLPFTLSSNQSGKGVQVDYLTASGSLEPLKTDYDYKTKRVYFDISHLSYFSPYYLPSVAWDNPFIDVRSYDWFYDSVFYVVDRQLMRGVSAERFVPESYTTRGMVVTILHRLAGLPAPEGENTFKDVKDDQWYTDAVVWASEKGLVNGYGGGRFGPDDKVTREQLGVMLHNYAKYVDITPKYGWDTPMRYSDAYKVSGWARQGAMYCQITGIITGRPSGGFEPQGIATRAELSTMLLRMNDQMQKQLESQGSNVG